jgi:predicted SnoaL-like aldol condensation-catalyzing enzyme/uncharacterized protein (DUF302 family)
MSIVERGNDMSESRFSVVHVRMKSERTFTDVQAAFERRLGRLDPDVYRALAEGGDPAAVRARLEAMAGSSGFMLFSTSDHGRVLRLVGQQRKAVQYVIGNPLFAVEMTRHAIGAALYAPLRVLIYEAEDGGTCIEFDRPSSLLGQFGDERVSLMAAALDQKLEDLAAAATRRGSAWCIRCVVDPHGTSTISTGLEMKMSQTIEETSKVLVLTAFDILFNKRDYAAAERFWSPSYIQHSAHIDPGREGLFNLVKSLPSTLKYEPGTIVADKEFVIVHGRYSGFGQPVNWIVADIVRIADGVLAEHWDVIQDEATRASSKSGLPMFGDRFGDSP